MRALGWRGSVSPADPVVMGILARRLSSGRNVVSQLHGEVSRRMWHQVWPGLPDDEVPIGSVTNGVHMPTWVAPEICELLRRDVGPDWWDLDCRDGPSGSVTDIPTPPLSPPPVDRHLPLPVPPAFLRRSRARSADYPHLALRLPRPRTSRTPSPTRFGQGDHRFLTIMRITRLEPIILHAPVTRGGIADSTHSLTHWGAPGVA